MSVCSPFVLMWGVDCLVSDSWIVSEKINE